MLLFHSKQKLLLALLIAGVSIGFFPEINESSVFAAAEKTEELSASKTKKTSDKGSAKDQEESSEDEDYLADSDEASEYAADIYRCPECGYEQDLEGFCPDHNETELIKIADKARNPLAPVEYDGNEDILVDIPLKNLQFKKEQLSEPSEDEPKDPESENKQPKDESR